MKASATAISVQWYLESGTYPSTSGPMPPDLICQINKINKCIFALKKKNSVACYLPSTYCFISILSLIGQLIHLYESYT